MKPGFHYCKISSDGWQDILVPVVDCYQGREGPSLFLLRFCVCLARYLQISGVRRSAVRESLARQQGSSGEPLPPARRPSHVRRYHAGFSYQARSLERARRVVAKVEWHSGELCPHVDFIVTNLSRHAGSSATTRPVSSFTPWPTSSLASRGDPGFAGGGGTLVADDAMGEAGQD